MTESNKMNYLDRFTLEINKRSDKLIEIFLFGYFLFGMITASFYDTWLIAISIGGLLLGVYFLSKKLFPGKTVNQYVASAAVGVFMGQFIYQSHGMFEMHFFAFIGATLLITYQNWKVQIPLALVVVAHHAIFGYLQFASYSQNLANRVYFTQLNYMDLKTFIIHCFLAVVILGICCLWAHDMKKRTADNAKNIHEVESLTSNFSKNLEFASMMANGVYQPVNGLDKTDPMTSVLVDIQDKLSGKASG